MPTEVKPPATRAGRTVTEHAQPRAEHASDSTEPFGHGMTGLQPQRPVPTPVAPSADGDALHHVAMASELAASRWLSAKAFLLRWALWLLQIGVALGAGYWIATVVATPDARIALGVHEAKVLPDSTVTVTTAPVTARKVERSISAVGNLHGYDEVTLKNKISGRVLKIHHDFADRVQPGELLMKIDPTDAQLAVEQSKRSLNSELARWGFQDVPGADADLTQLPTVVSARLRSEWSRSQLSRLTALSGRGSVSAEEIEEARTNAMVAESDYANQLQLARAGVATAQLKKADLDIAEQQLVETQIYVPLREDADKLPDVHYTITDRFVTEGAWLPAGAELFRLVIDDTLKLRLTIPEKHASGVLVGQRVEVSTLSSTEPVLGSVTRIGPAVDPTNRTFQVEAEIPNPNGVLKTGGFAKANVVTNSADTTQTVPLMALVSFAGVHKLFVVDGDIVKEVHVKLGEQTSEWVEILEPRLSESVHVVTSGQSKLSDGATIALRNNASDDGAASDSARAASVQTTDSTHSTDPSPRGAGEPQ